MTETKSNKMLTVLVLLVVVLSAVLTWKVYEANNPAVPEKAPRVSASNPSAAPVLDDSGDSDVAISIVEQTKEEA